MTYLALAVVFLVPAAAVAAVASVRRGLGRRWWTTTALTLAVLLALTAVFDSVIIASGLVRYDAAALAGVTVLRAPIEDFAWPVAAALGLPALWELLGGAGRSAPAGREDR